MDSQTTQILIQGGAVGLCLASFGIILYLIATLRKIVGNHINHMTAAILELTVVIKELKQFLVDNKNNANHT